MTRSVIDRLVSITGAIMGVVLLAAASLLFFAHSYVHNQVTDQLREQQITFPAEGSKGLTSLPESDQKEIAKYAGQTMTNGAQAKAFADHYIKVHLGEVAEGQTYSQVSSKALANPDDKALAGQVQTLFRGETLRGLLLNAYAFDTMATVALIAAWVAVGAGVLLILLALLGLRHAATTAATGAPKSKVEAMA
ncbi:MAG TPA: hypothetical protein VI357_11545 [Mycobacteriales bacterium]